MRNQWGNHIPICTLFPPSLVGFAHESEFCYDTFLLHETVSSDFTDCVYTLAEVQMQHSKTTLMMAVVAGLLALSAFVPMLGQTSNAWSCPPYQCITNGRMTGGPVLSLTSTNYSSISSKLTMGFELHCSTAASPNNLEINWGGNSFHLESYEYVQCFNDNSTLPNPPSAPFNLLEANGHGRLNGVPGAFVFVQLFDGGEPGTANDWATVVIYAANGTLVMNVHGPLIGGNIQAHYSNK